MKGRHKALFTIKKQPQPSLHIDCDFPGGNIIVERVNGHTVYLHQDLRDTAGYWFYWYFRVCGAAGRNLTFNFTQGKAIGERGPAVSLNKGKRWTWLGRKGVKENSFKFPFHKDIKETRFCFGIPYLEANLAKFLRRYQSSRYLKTAKLCKTREGRLVERLHLGCLRGNPRYRVLVTCRHHACEVSASYVLEGLMQAILSRTKDGRWLHDNVEFLVIPFVDKDGVENGDQGKKRRPHDHNQDYKGRSIYESVKALRGFVPGWSRGKLRVAFDLHCPWIHTDQGEGVHLVGSDRESMWQEQNCFSGILEKVQTGPVVFCAKDNLPYGQRWNKAENWKPGKNFASWALSLPGIKLVSAIEIPYATARGKEVNTLSARLFGKDLAKALRVYLDVQRIASRKISTKGEISVAIISNDDRRSENLVAAKRRLGKR